MVFIVLLCPWHERDRVEKVPMVSVGKPINEIPPPHSSVSSPNLPRDFFCVVGFKKQ